MRSFTADRLKPRRADLLVVLLVLLSALALTLALRPREGGRLTAVVTVDGVEVARQDLTALTEPRLLELEGLAYPVTVEFAPGRARIRDSTCPGGDCQAAGWAERAGARIVCLPNRLIVALDGGGTDDVDAVTG